MRSSKRKNLIKHSFLILAFALASLFGHIWLNAKSDEKVEFILESKSSEIKKNLQQKLQNHLNVMNRLAARSSISLPKTNKAWKNKTQQIFKDFEGIQAIEWIDKGSTVEWVYPNVGNNVVVGKQLSFAQNDMVDLKKSVELKESFFSRSGTFIQGGDGFFSIHPSFNNSDHQGFVVSVYKYKSLFDALIPSGYELNLHTNGELVFSNVSKGNRSEKYIFSKLKSIDLGGQSIQLELRQTPKLIQSISGQLELANYRIFVFVIFIFFMIFVISNYNHRENLEDINVANIKLNTSLNLALDNIKIGTWELTPYNNKIYLSERADRIYGLENQTVSSFEKWLAFVHPDDRERVDGELKTAIESERFFKADFRIVNYSGQIKHIRTVANTQIGRNIKNRRVYGISWDITDEKNSEFDLIMARDKAEIAAKTKSEFLANMSHEIRTPMNGVLGMASLLSKTNLDVKQREMLDIINSCGNGLLTVLNDILDFSKIEAGKMDIEKKPFHLKKCVEESAFLLSSKASQKYIELSYGIENGLPEFFLGDVTRIKQILVNFISNAVKFTNEGEVDIKISSRKIDNNRYQIKFTVRDSGIGISEKNKEKLFKAFSQADTSITRSFGGTGLGLVISAKLASYMGGLVYVDSELGKGSIFTLEIPLEATTGVLNQVENRQRKYGERFGQEYPLKILVVEDNMMNQRIATMMLKKLGYTCELASNGAVAIDLISKGGFDFVFMDMQMPVMDGVTATKKIVESYGIERPIIVAMTANVLQEDREKCFSAGMDEFITKPISIEKLGNIIVDLYPSKLSKKIS